MIEMLRRWYNTRATIKALQSLSDKELKDIGINRGEIYHIAHAILDVHRMVRDKGEHK